MWRRWQLTALVAALSRPIRARTADVSGSGGDSRARSPEAGGPVSATDEFAGLPVLLGGARARQVGATTCGSAVLVMLAATGDPQLAQWLDTGRLPAGPLPPEIPPTASSTSCADSLPAPAAARAGAAPAEAMDPVAVPAGTHPVSTEAAARFAAAQRRVQERTGRRAIGPLRWPAALGTPPWAAAREARFPGVRYRVRAVDDGASEARDLLGLVVAATHRGHPVPLYTGGDLRGGVGHAVPRHVVLAVPPPAGGGEPGILHLYEPGRGHVHRVPLDALLDRTEPHPALGGWTHVTVALLPVPA